MTRKSLMRPFYGLIVRKRWNWVIGVGIVPETLIRLTSRLAAISDSGVSLAGSNRVANRENHEISDRRNRCRGRLSHLRPCTKNSRLVVRDRNRVHPWYGVSVSAVDVALVRMQDRLKASVQSRRFS